MRKALFAIKIFVIIAVLILPVFALSPAHAQEKSKAGQDALNFLDNTAQLSGLGKTASGEDATLTLIGNIINVVLGFVGIIFFVLVFSAGFKWMTSQGNEDAVKEAKGTIKTAVIGIAVVFTAFLITNFVLNQIKSISKPITNSPEEIWGLCYYMEPDDQEHCGDFAVPSSVCTLEDKCDFQNMQLEYNACDMSFRWEHDIQCD